MCDTERVRGSIAASGGYFDSSSCRACMTVAEDAVDPPDKNASLAIGTSEWLKDIDKKEGMNSNDLWNVKQLTQDSDESGTCRIRECHVTGKMFAVVYVWCLKFAYSWWCLHRSGSANTYA